MKEIKQHHVVKTPTDTIDYITNAGSRQGRWGLGSTNSVSIEYNNLSSKANRCIVPSNEGYIAGVHQSGTVALVTNNNEVVQVKSITNWINNGKLKIKNK